MPGNSPEEGLPDRLLLTAEGYQKQKEVFPPDHHISWELLECDNLQTNGPQSNLLDSHLGCLSEAHPDKDLQFIRGFNGLSGSSTAKRLKFNGLSLSIVEGKFIREFKSAAEDDAPTEERWSGIMR